MALVVVYLPEALKIPSDKLVGLTLVMLFAFPSALALVIGGCVPHIYRSARRAATARRDEASHLLTPALPAPQPSAFEALSVGTTEDGGKSAGEHDQQRAAIIQRKGERPVVASPADRIDTKRRKSAGNLRAGADLCDGRAQEATPELPNGKREGSAASRSPTKPGKKRPGSMARPKQPSEKLDGATSHAEHMPT
jgi:hypothetical protein